MTQRPGRAKPQTLEDEVLRFALAHPELGQFSAARALTQEGVPVSASTVRNIWKKHGLETSYQRLTARTQESAHAPSAPLSDTQRTLLKRERFNRKLMAQARQKSEPLSELRREQLLLAAAKIFAQKGYAATSLREVCAAAGIQPASLYYHFPSKEELFATVHALGMARILSVLDETAARYDDPWTRLEEATATALKFMLDASELAVVVRVDTSARFRPSLQRRLDADRAAYEDRFRALIDALPVHDSADRTLLRLALLGAINWTHVWYRPGRLSPEEIGRGFIRSMFSRPAMR